MRCYRVSSNPDLADAASGTPILSFAPPDNPFVGVAGDGEVYHVPEPDAATLYDAALVAGFGLTRLSTLRSGIRGRVGVNTFGRAPRAASPAPRP